MFRRLLVANRGEIACRVMRTARRLGIGCVAVYSEPDARALHVAAADEAYCIGPAEARRSYLVAEKILEAAALAGCDAIHPGYGFLSENAEFADACRNAGFIFVGPSADAMRAMGSKREAKAIMASNGIPVVPGYHGAAQDLAALAEAADRIGYPVLIKAVAGGGGKGMQIVETRRALAPAIARAAREAAAAFGDGSLLLETYLPRPRHVEVQVFADRHGNALHLFERDCSLQRRYQKIIEEAPAPGLDVGVRRALGDAAVNAARAIGYEGAGTVEFLIGDEGRFYFMEMNTRLQVEHPVTEMITGLDLVEWQLRVAAGEPLPLGQDDLACTGHAFEARIYAEDPAEGFLPAAGTIRHLRFPPEGPHVRIDTGIGAGDRVGVDYDPMIAKLIVCDADRDRALQRLRRALAETQIVGVTTNLDFLAACAGHPAFAQAEVDTHFIDRHRHDLLPAKAPAPARFLALACLDVLLRRDDDARAAAGRTLDPYSPWNHTNGWRLNDDNDHRLRFRDGEEIVEVTVHYRRHGWLIELQGGGTPIAATGELDAAGDLVAELAGIRLKATVVRHGDEMVIMTGGESRRLVLDNPAARAELVEASGGSLKAPMPGKVLAVHAKAGDVVTRGTALMVLEAMKMEHAVTAPVDGTISRLHFAVGEQVEEGAVLVSFADADDAAPAG
jgi:3-methylcrotonyl-CoA carboxylase alpha subunit